MTVPDNPGSPRQNADSACLAHAEIRCPVCGAPPNEPCQYRAGRVRKVVHSARERAAKAAHGRPPATGGIADDA